MTIQGGITAINKVRQRAEDEGNQKLIMAIDIYLYEIERWKDEIDIAEE